MKTGIRNYHFYTPFEVSERKRRREFLGNLLSVIFLLAGLYLLLSYGVCRWSSEHFQDVSELQLWAMAAGAAIFLLLSFFSPAIAKFLIWVPRRRLTIRK